MVAAFLGQHQGVHAPRHTNMDEALNDYIATNNAEMER